MLVLKELDAWLKDNRPEVLEALGPPATASELAALLAGLKKGGYPADALPEELVALLSWRTGMMEYVSGADDFFLQRNLMRADWMIECHAIMVGHGDDNEDGEPAHFHRGWIPFVDNSWSLLCVDAVGTFGHAPGALVYMDFKGDPCRDIVVPSLGAWFEYFLELLKHPEVGRAFVLDDEHEDYDELQDALTDLEDAMIPQLFPGYPIAHSAADMPDDATANRVAEHEASQLLFMKLEKTTGDRTLRWECDVDQSEVVERLVDIGKTGTSTAHDCASDAEAAALAQELKQARLADGFKEI